MSDYYLENLSRLEGQPKRTIADYVESNGILVPKRFSLEQARTMHLPIIRRSEHLDEYARRVNGKLVTGVSGLLESPDLAQYPNFDEEAIKNQLFKEPNVGQTRVSQYCNWMGINTEDFMQGVTFSYWEKLAGYNRAIIADSSIPGRYHITTSKEGDGCGSDWARNYTIFENDKIVSSYYKPLPESITNGFQELVRLYEQVRNLPHFDKNNCPIIEVQTVGSQNYFLQYHRTRDFNESTFVLERPPTNQEREALFVRGATPLEGITCDVTVLYTWWDIIEGNTPTQSDTLPDKEEGAFDLGWDQVYPEIMAPKRKIQMIRGRNLDHELMQVAIGHIQRSKLFKPEVSLIYGEDDLQFPKDLREKLEETQQDQKIKLSVISDGRRAYYLRVD